jgi:hypothetical protein
MARIKIRIELNRGREGILPRKLIAHTERLEEFLKSLANDLNVPREKNEWLAKDFENGSCLYTLELQAVENAAKVAEFNSRFRGLTSYSPESDTPPTGVSELTLLKYSDLRESLDVDEPIRFGIYEGEDKPDWITGSRTQMQEVADSTNVRAEYIGSVMGIVHELNKGANPPYIKVRDLVSGDLIRCDYQNKDYDHVVALVKKRDAVVNVYGLITVNRLTKRVELVKATLFELAPTFSKSDYEAFFGCSPKLLDGESSEDYIRKNRKDGRYKA